MADADSSTRLNGRYRIERELGAGGMATVYLAEDLRHRRKVALKVLKPELAAVIGSERFLAEIETTANLQHPHILPLFDSGEADGYLFYVMPYVEGESLRERLDRERQLPVDEAVNIASKVANALDYAHRQGVIHRDIKPANVLLSETGEPLVSDFGIALAVSAGGGDRLTETGLNLGTPHYMSPEQATGDLSVGPTTDIYGLGCVLYEMLVGDPPYTGSTPQAVLGKIITAEAPAVSEERASVPPNVEETIEKALEKIPADRFVTAAALVEALADAGFRYGKSGRVDEVRVGRSLVGHLGWVVAAALGIVALFLWSSDAANNEVREHLTIQTTELPQKPGLDISRHGSFVVYGGRQDDGGMTRLWIRRWALPEATPIPGTEGAGTLLFPAISPSQDEVAFHHPSEHDLRVVDLATGAVRVVGDLDPLDAPAWSPDGRWLYLSGPAGSGELWRVPAIGGQDELILEEGEVTLAVSESGTLVHAGFQPTRHEFLVIDRTGEITPVEPGWTFDAGDANAGWSLSPDGERVAFRAATDDGLDIWIREVDGGRLEWIDRVLRRRYGREACDSDPIVPHEASGRGERWFRQHLPCTMSRLPSRLES